VLARAEDPEQLCSARDAEGRPWIYTPADARDVTRCVCALDNPAAVGEAFSAPETAVALPHTGNSG